MHALKEGHEEHLFSVINQKNEKNYVRAYVSKVIQLKINDKDTNISDAYFIYDK